MSVPTSLLFCRRTSLPVVLACVLPCLLAAQQKDGAPFRITGTVVNAQDNAPVPRCRVAALLAGGGRGAGRELVQAESDERGRFGLEVPSQGTWRVTVSGHNIHTQTLDQHDSFFTGVVLTAAHPVYDVAFRTVPDGVLAGHVTDEAGEPVRNADVGLFGVDSATQRTALNAQRRNAQTDDRGRYEFAGLGAGSYLVNVRAHPWYAPQGAGGPRPAAVNGTDSALDPSLDVVYPVTWFPGVTEDAAAGVLAIHPGDRAEADFHLSPMAAAHLVLPLPVIQNGAPERFGRGMPSVSMLLPSGVVQPVFGNISVRPTGEMDMGGLAPGTYQVTVPGDPPRTTVVHVMAGGSFTEAGAGGSTVTIAVDGGTTVQASQVVLVDTATGRTITSRPGSGGRPQQRMALPNPGTPSPQVGLRMLDGPEDPVRPRAGSVAATVQVPEGRYEVRVPLNAGVFITGLSARGAVVQGRFVTVAEGDVQLTVHLASGLAGVDGLARFHDQPAVGAMVLLVPATLGDGSSLTIVRRDQTNTDGSFHLAGVIPGQYILLAIDHGWAVNWNDPATLARYLVHGTPVDLGTPGASASVPMNVVAVAP